MSAISAVQSAVWEVMYFLESLTGGYVHSINMLLLLPTIALVVGLMVLEWNDRKTESVRAASCDPPPHPNLNGSPVLVMVAKLPVPGKSKTRLAARIGDNQAAAFSRASIGDLSRRLSRLPNCKRILLYAPATEDAICAFELLLGNATSQWELLPMVSVTGSSLVSSNLTVQLSAAVSRLQERGCGPILFIGSDCPDLPDSTIQHAFSTVCADPKKAVLCPASDGGYVLLGLPVGASTGVFDGVAWSCEETLKSQTAALEREGLQVTIGETYIDVDEFPDLEVLKSRLETSKESRDACPLVCRFVEGCAELMSATSPAT